MQETFLNPNILKENGWKQGACLDIDLQQAVYIDTPSKYERLPAGLYIMLSQDCDILQRSLSKEPVVEVIRATAIEQCSPDKERGKNPRLLHLNIEKIGALAFLPNKRFFIPRDQLETLSAHSAIVKGKALKILVNWVANRYIRPGFPDAFNERVRPINDKLRRIIKKHTDSTLGLFVRVLPDDEISVEQNYKVRIVLLTHEDFDYDESEQAKLEENFDKIIFLFDEASGIEVDLADGITGIRSEKEMNYFELKTLKKWDFDFLSFLNEEVGETVKTTLLS